MIDPPVRPERCRECRWPEECVEGWCAQADSLGSWRAAVEEMRRRAAGEGR